MRKIDLHCYPGTAEWIASQGPFVEALSQYWKREWVAKEESEVVADFKAAGVEAVLVAFDIESVTGAPPCTNDYVAGFRDRHPGRIVQAWAPRAAGAAARTGAARSPSGARPTVSGSRRMRTARALRATRIAVPKTT